MKIFVTSEVIVLCMLFSGSITSLLTFAIATQLDKSISNRTFLQFLPSVFFIHLLYLFIIHLFWPNIPALDYAAPFFLLYGPIIWHGAKVLENPNYRLRNIWAHLIPFLAFIPINIFLAVSLERTPNFYYFITFLLISSMVLLIYTIVSIVKVVQVQKMRLNANKIIKSLFNFLLFNVIGSVCIIISLSIYRYISPESIIPLHLNYLIYYVIFVITFVVFWSVIDFCRNYWQGTPEEAFWTSNIVLNKKDINLKESDKNMIQVSKTSRLKKEPHKSELHKKIENLPSDIFKNQSFKLKDLCEILEEPRYVVTKVINEEMNTNFNSLVNLRRLEIAKKLLTEINENELSISEIRELSGFASDATFYRVFREEFGITPREFQKSR